MKKSLLAIALITSCAFANAATVYDKGGNSLDLSGRVQTRYQSKNYDPIKVNNNGKEKSKATLINSAKLIVSGKSKINSNLSAFGYGEWDLPSGVKSDSDKVTAKEEYVGLAFYNAGNLLFGRTYDNTKQVLQMTDVFDSVGLQGNMNGDLRSGVARYDLNYMGFNLSAAFQFPEEHQPEGLGGSNVNLKSGFGATAGYTFDQLSAGPITFKVGCFSAKAEKDTTPITYGALDKANMFTTGLSFGSQAQGIYVAGMFYSQTGKFKNDTAKEKKIKRNGYEAVVGYTLDNGLGAFVGYEVQKLDPQEGKDHKKTLKKVPVQVKYNITPNFSVWAEAQFDVSSKNVNKKAPGNEKGSKYELGARYTF